MSDSFFRLPNGDIASELEVVVPVKGRIRVTAQMVQELDELRDIIEKHQHRQSYFLSGSIRARLVSVIDRYQEVAADSLQSAKSVRDDMLSYLRSIQFVCETLVCEQSSHAEKNARIRGVLSVIGHHIKSLRAEEFNFKDGVWRNNPDLFRWDGPEQRLREENDRLKAELADLKQLHASSSTDESVNTEVDR